MSELDVHLLLTAIGSVLLLVALIVSLASLTRFAHCLDSGWSCLLLLEPEATIAAIPSLLPPSMEERQKALAVIRHVVSASGELSGEAAERLKQVAALFAGRPLLPSSEPSSIPFDTVERAKAS
jgi:hypothetical protein